MVPPAVPDAWNAITGRVIGCAMEVHSHLGPGLLERLYEDAMCHELRASGLVLGRQVPVTMRYKGAELSGLRLDLVVAGLVVVELKAIDVVADAHLAQLASYLRCANIPLGLLINFNVPLLKDGVYRRLDPRVVVERVGSPNGLTHATSSPPSYSGSL